MDSQTLINFGNTFIHYKKNVI